MAVIGTHLAPLQLLAAAFDDLQFDWQIWEPILKLRDQGLIRLVDAAVLARTVDDDIVAIEVADLPEGTAHTSGRIIRRILHLEAPARHRPSYESALGEAMLVDSEYEYGITAEELQTIVEDIPRRGAMVALLVEHRWSLPIKQAVSDAGGCLLAQDFISPEALVPASDQLLRPPY